jgi:hypothetical protein
LELSSTINCSSRIDQPPQADLVTESSPEGTG